MAISKYGLAKELIETLAARAREAGLDPGDVEEAMLISLVQSLKAARGAADVRSILQYEIDSLGSGDVYEIQRR